MDANAAPGPQPQSDSRSPFPPNTRLPQGSAPAGTKKKRWPWIAGCGCLGVLVAAAVVVALMVWLLPTINGGNDPAAAGPQASEAPRVPDSVEVDFISATARFPKRWEEADLSHKTVVRTDGGTNHEHRGWQWFERPDDRENYMERERVLYELNGTSSTPRSGKVDPARVDPKIDELIKRWKNRSSDELQLSLSTVGHGCYSETRLLEDPVRIENQGLTGFYFSYECVGSRTGQLGLRGFFVQMVDQYGDTHFFTISTDHENFDAKREEFLAVIKSFQAK